MTSIAFLIGFLAGTLVMFLLYRWSERRMFAEIERAMTGVRKRMEVFDGPEAEQ